MPSRKKMHLTFNRSATNIFGTPEEMNMVWLPLISLLATLAAFSTTDQGAKSFNVANTY